MKLVLAVSLLTTLGMVSLYGILMGVMISGWKKSAGELWNVAAIQTRDSMMEVVNSTLEFVQFAAKSVPQLEPFLGEMKIGDSGFNPAYLLRSFAAFQEKSGYSFGSFGFLMRANSSLPEGSKVSWQIANGFGCPKYMYAYSDNSINPKFYGYCGLSNGTVDFSNRAYTGNDWGLKPQEIGLLDGTIPSKGIFLPIFDLLGAFTLTYELAYPSDRNPAYAVTFAELDLTTLSNHISNQTNLLNNKAIAYIYESSSGFMIASNIPSTLFAANGTRYTVSNNPSIPIKMTYQGKESGWLSIITERSENGLNWTIVVAVEESEIYGNLNASILAASLISLAVLIVLTVLLCVGIHMCVTKQLYQKKEGKEISYSIIDESNL